MRLLLGGAALVALLGLGAGYFVLRGGGVEPAPEATPRDAGGLKPSATPRPRARARGVILVDSEPQGADVTLDGQARGLTPLTIPDLIMGEHWIELSLAGYRGVERSVMLTEADPRHELKPVLTREPPPAATLTVLSTPAGVPVTIDGAAAGHTPLTDYRVRPGSRLVELRKPGYEPWAQTVTAAAGRGLRIDAELQALLPPSTPRPAPTLDTTRVYLNTAAEVDAPARKVSGRSVSYPDGAPRLRSGQSVWVRLSFVVDEEGSVVDIQVVESGGTVLDDAVVSTIKTWKYSPAVKQGVTVKVRLEFKQTFRAG